MRIVFGADDESPTVQAVRNYLHEHGISYWEPSGQTTWVEIAQQAAASVAAGQSDYAILLCWTGTGVSIAANKVPGIRAATAWEPWVAKHARLWNDANVLTMSLKRTAPDVAVEIVEAFLNESNPDPDEEANIRSLER
jgi:ribose 5-phosphate isomerase B